MISRGDHYSSINRCVNGRPICRRRGDVLCGNSTCYQPHSEICCLDNRGRSRTYARRHGCCGLRLNNTRSGDCRAGFGRRPLCGARRYDGGRKVCTADGTTVADLLCPRHESSPLGAPLSQYSRLCAGAEHGMFTQPCLCNLTTSAAAISSNCTLIRVESATLGYYL